MKKIFFKAVSLVLVLMLAFGSFSAAAASESEKEYDYDMLPVIFVSGFGATTLAEQQEDGSLTAVFPPSIDSILDYLLDNLGALAAGLFDTLLFGKTEKLAGAIAPLILKLADVVALNPDGSSKYSNIVPIVEGAANTSLEAFTKNGMLAYVPYTGSEFLDMEMVGDVIGDDKVFNFTYDWRRSHIDVAEDFRQYVKDVLALTGAQKVNVYSISQGSLILGAYLYSYAEDGLLNNIFFDTPALEGTDLVTKMFGKDDLTLNPEYLGPLLSQIMHTELDLSFVISLLPVNFINTAIDYARRDLLLPSLIYGTAFWDMLPTSELEELQEYWLDPVESKAIIEKTNALHYGFMSNIKATFDRAEENGAKISIKTGAGIPMIIGSQDNSDGIVNVKYSCGAVTAALGQTFADDYVQAKSGKYAISPDRTVDLSTAYYPERTWVIENNAHGQAEWDPRSLDLIITQLMTKGVDSAYSSYDFPQFMESMAPNDKIFFGFTATNSSFLPFENGEFIGKAIITNVSNEDKLIIKGIDCELIKSTDRITLKPGESVELELVGSADEMSFETVTISYKTGLFSKTKTADFGITVINSADYAGVIEK